MIRPPAPITRTAADAGYHAADIDGELPVERCKVVLRIIHRTVNRDTSVVDQDVEATETFNDRLDQALNLGGIGLVGPEGRRVDALALKFPDDRLSLVCRGHVADGDVGAVVGKCPRRCRADTRASRRLPGQLYR